MVVIHTVLNLFRPIYQSIKLAYYKAKWRTRNSNNYTIVNNIFSFDNIFVGKGTYGIITVYRWCSDGEGLQIGNYCSIASRVKFILGGNHHTDTISTYPFSHFYDGGKNVAVSKGPIIVGDDVWIGSDVVILSGIRIGKGAVIAAGTVVTKNVEAYSIVGGNPARVLKMRFSPGELEIINKVDFDKLDEQKILNNLGVLSEQLANKDESFIKDLCRKLE